MMIQTQVAPHPGCKKPLGCMVLQQSNVAISSHAPCHNPPVLVDVQLFRSARARCLAHSVSNLTNRQEGKLAQGGHSGFT